MSREVLAVWEAWNHPGLMAGYHRAWQARLRTEWPALALALDNLEKPVVVTPRPVEARPVRASTERLPYVGARSEVPYGPVIEWRRAGTAPWNRRVECSVCGRTGLPGCRWAEACLRGHRPCDYCGKMQPVKMDGMPRVHTLCEGGHRG